MKWLKEKINGDRWFDWIETVVHEMMHALGFSPSLWKYFLTDDPVVITEDGRSWVVDPATVSHG